MPPRPAWHSRINQILEEVERFPAPVLDRAALETLFHLRRRQAIRLMASLPGHLSGHTGLIDREVLSEGLGKIKAGKAAATELRRKEQLAASLQGFAQTAATRLAPIAIPPAPVQGEFPEGIALAGPGELRIAFASAEELLGRILLLTESAAEDYAGFRARIEEAVP